ncbi:MAG: hypothetical protein R3E79_28950 [Caldilineaceae bacterium]
MQANRHTRCTKWGQQEIGVQFSNIGNQEQFVGLLDDFKLYFTDRYWHKFGWWILPEYRLTDLEMFCQRHNLSIKWVEALTVNKEKMS